MWLDWVGGWAGLSGDGIFPFVSISLFIFALEPFADDRFRIFGLVKLV